jgi:hypothetical protein
MIHSPDRKCIMSMESSAVEEGFPSSGQLLSIEHMLE